MNFKSIHSAASLMGLLAWATCIPVFAQSTGKPPVVVSAVQIVEAKPLVRVVGTVQPVKTSVIGSAVAGRVVAIQGATEERESAARSATVPYAPFEIERGDIVDMGAPLAQLRTDTLKLEQRAAEAQLRLAEQQLAELENGSLPEEILQAEAIALGAKSAMDNSASALRRLKSLVTSGAATATDLESANERATMARYAYEAAMAAKKRVSDGPRIEQIEQARAQVELQRLSIELIEDRITKHTIIAPFRGYVSAKYSELGAWINAGDPIAEVIQIDEVEIVAPVPSEQANKIQLNEQVQVEFPDGLRTGRVHRVVPVADPRSRTYPVIIRVANELREGQGPLLMPGMLARVAIPWGTAVTAPAVPKDALVLNYGDKAVYVVDPIDGEKTTTVGLAPKVGKVRRVSVQVGIALDGDMQIEGDLKDGEFVVVLGNERLPQGAEVEVVEVRDNDRARLGAKL